MGFKATVALATAVLSTSALAESSIKTTFGAEMWMVDTEVNEVKRDSDNNPGFYLSVENDLDYVPNARLRYSTVDTEYMAFDKSDLTLYYPVLDHELMHFEAGITFSDLGNTKYKSADTNQESSFDKTIWAWYGYAEITVPDTQFDIIGEMNFGNGDIKSTDLMAGAQYRLPVGEHTAKFRAGYRVIDLDSDQFSSLEGKSFIFAHGLYLGADFTF
jgi:outer membrane protein